MKNGYGVSVFGSTITFTLGGDGPSLLDHLSDFEALNVIGVVSGTVVGTQIQATMNGEIDYSYGSYSDAPVACRAMHHVVTLRR